MNPAPTAPVQSPPTAVPAKPSRSTVLRQIIRTLIDFGRQRLATVRSQPGPQETHAIACAFGTFNLALIVARILRGLRIAAALETRVIATAPALDAPPPARAAAPPRPSRLRAKPKRPDAEDNAALLARLPTEQEIAAMVRRRPIGAVLIDICQDLGIGFDHPLWHELQDVIIDHDGQVAPVMKRTIERIRDAHREIGKRLPPNGAFYSASQHMGETTGPPPLSLAA